MANSLHSTNPPVDLPDEEVLFGTTPLMQEVRRTIDDACREGYSVVIQGEGGTGKTEIANYIHHRCSQSGAPLVKLNCAAVAPGRLEKEILGSESSAKAAGGTLFLYEAGEVDAAFQSALLGMLRRRWITNRRAAIERLNQARIVYAAGLEASAAREGSSEQGVVWVQLPALRERKQDIPRMCEFLMRKQARKFGKAAQQLTPATLQVLKEWRWPGNIRELENWIARVVILGSQEELTAELGRQTGILGRPGKESLPKKQPLTATQGKAELAQAIIVRAMQTNGWSRRKAAEELKVSYRSLSYSLRGANVPRRRKSHREIPPTQ